jgi:hypothetical protein
LGARASALSPSSVVAPRPAPSASKDRRETFDVMRDSSSVFMRFVAFGARTDFFRRLVTGTNRLRPLPKAGKQIQAAKIAQ